MGPGGIVATGTAHNARLPVLPYLHYLPYLPYLSQVPAGGDESLLLAYEADTDEGRSY